MTRRIMKPQPGFDAHRVVSPGTEQFFHDGEPDGWRPSKVWKLQEASGTNGGGTTLSKSYRCPYGRPGDLLWVKETFEVLAYNEESKSLSIRYEDDDVMMCNLENREWTKFSKWKKKYGRKSSLFLFKSCSRIWLQVEWVRVERLQDISEEDAVSEGIENYITDTDVLPVYRNYTVTRKELEADHWAHCADDSIDSFKSLWMSINGPESWENNPWVWVIKFKVLSTTGMP